TVLTSASVSLFHGVGAPGGSRAHLRSDEVYDGGVPVRLPGGAEDHERGGSAAGDRGAPSLPEDERERGGKRQKDRKEQHSARGLPRAHEVRQEPATECPGEGGSGEGEVAEKARLREGHLEGLVQEN